MIDISNILTSTTVLMICHRISGDSLASRFSWSLTSTAAASKKIRIGFVNFFITTHPKCCAGQSNFKVRTNSPRDHILIDVIQGLRAGSCSLRNLSRGVAVVGFAFETNNTILHRRNFLHGSQTKKIARLGFLGDLNGAVEEIRLIVHFEVS